MVASDSWNHSLLSDRKKRKKEEEWEGEEVEKKNQTTSTHNLSLALLLNLADVNFFRFVNYCDCGGSGEKLQCISLWSTL